MADDLFTKHNFENVFICQNCNASNRSASGAPSKCRKCNSKRLRLKKKKRKSAA
jgi:ribosomal protein L40E